MKLTSSLLVLAIAGGVAPLAEAGQQGLEMEWRQKAIPAPVILDGCGGLKYRNARLDPIVFTNDLKDDITIQGIHTASAIAMKKGFEKKSWTIGCEDECQK